MGNEAPVAVVTGSGAGIGAATARALAERGHRIVVADLNGDAASTLADEFLRAGMSALAVTVDVGDENGVVALVEQTKAAWGRIDVLVNNAGIVNSAPFLDIGFDEYERVMRINTAGVWLCCQAVIPLMLRQNRGTIVNVSSVAGQRGGGLLGTAAYSTSKGAVIAMTKALAREFASAGLRVNAVAPAATKTSLVQREVKRLDDDTMARVKAATPLGRIAEPAEVAAVIAFLACDESSFVTGQVYNVDGGVAM